MALCAEHLNIEKRLETMLSSTSQPPEVAGAAHDLLDSLRRSVRIGFFGDHPNVRSRLINRFLGAALVPERLTCPAWEIGWGAKSRVWLTRPDGTVDRIDGDLGSVSDHRSVFFRLETDHEALKRVNLLSMQAGGSAREVQAAIRWTLAKIDVFVWASSEFATLEQDIWSRVPQGYQDHAFLALYGPGSGHRTKELRARLEDEFLAVIPVDHPFGAPGEPFRDDHEPCGLTRRLSEHLEKARLADYDKAFLFLRRNDSETASPCDDHSREEAPKPERVLQAVPNWDDDVATSPDQGEPGQDQCERLVDFCCDARTLLANSGYDMRKIVLSRDAVEVRTIVDHCSAALSMLSNLLSSEFPDLEGEEIGLTMVLSQAEQMMASLRQEDTPASALDAVAILQQLQFEYDCMRADPGAHLADDGVGHAIK